MALELPKPPDGVVEAVRNALIRHGQRLIDPKAEARNADIEFTPAAAHLKFTIDLPAPADASELEKARVVGWRTLVCKDERVVAVVETAADDNGSFRFRAMDAGPSGSGTAEALSKIEGDKRLLRSKFDVRLLVVAPLQITALWLHRAKGGNDYFVIQRPLAQRMKPNEMLTQRKFFKALQETLLRNRELQRDGRQ